ncbi:MAG TPA: hypothetical protein VIV20_01860 [Gammaproteobacteria bacterium]
MSELRSVAILVSLVLIVYSAVTRADILRQVKFNSNPVGAVVCKKVLKNETCHGKTPFSLNLEFNNQNESKKFVFYKTGYQTETIQVTPESNDVSITLQKLDLFPDPALLHNKQLKELQEAINFRTEKAIYSYAGGKDENFQLIGRLEALNYENLTGLKFSVLINNYSVLKDIKKASRISNNEKKYRQLMKTLNRHGIFEFYDMIAGSVASLPIDVVEFDVTYSGAQAVLDYNQVKETYSRWTGTTCSGSGSSRTCYDTFDVYTKTKDVTVVKDENVTVDYIFIADHKELMSSPGADIYDQLDQVRIYTNDNPKNEYEQIKPGPETHQD